MNRRLNWTKLSLALVATWLMGSTANAQCDSGGCDVAVGGTAFVGGCASGHCDRGSGFGYPGGSGCQGAACGVGGGGHNGPFRQHAQHLMQIHRRDFARNQAWPKPFDCADRQLYHCIWNPMLDAGCRSNCLFTANHFDTDTNELNDMGRAKVRSIFRNFAMADKYALVQNDGNRSVADSRLQNLQNAIDNWYGSDAFVEVAVTDLYPVGFAGSRAESINNLSLQETPPPVIPVASGAGSTSDVAVGQ